MRLNHLDSEILKLLWEKKEGMHSMGISKVLNKNQSFVWKRLKVMEGKRIVRKVEGYPIFYRLVINHIIKEPSKKMILCPFCEAKWEIDENQYTKWCRCKTKTGKRRRILAVPKNIITKTE